MDNEKEIPFGAFDSELMHQEIFIPEGFTATIEGDKIILKKTENEDEKVRKALIEYFNEQCDMSDWNGVYGYQVVAWLEKQGEPFDDNIITRDDEILQAISIGLTDAKEDLGWSDFGGIPIEEIQNWLEKQGNQNHIEQNLEMVEALRTEYEKGRADAFAEMQKEWSEEDEEMFEYTINLLNYNLGCRKWLQSLKERHIWKPSDAQIRALEYIINNASNTSYSCKIAKELLEQLKKLKGE